MYTYLSNDVVFLPVAVNALYSSLNIPRKSGVCIHCIMYRYFQHSFDVLTFYRQHVPAMILPLVGTMRAQNAYSPVIRAKRAPASFQHTGISTFENSKKNALCYILRMLGEGQTSMFCFPFYTNGLVK